MWVPYIRSFIPLSWVSFEQLNLNYPTLYGYIVGLTAAVTHALGLVVFPPKTLTLFSAGREALLLARGTTVAISLVTVGLVGLTATRMYSRRVGLAAAALAAVAPFEVVYAHIASPDVLLATGTVFTMLLAYRTARDSKAWLGAAAGFAAGMTFATKYTGLAMIAPVAWAAGESAIRTRSLRRGVILVLVGAIGFAAGVALGCPPCLLHADRMMDAMRNHFQMNRVLYPNLHNSFLTPTIGWYGRPYAYQLVASLPFVLGWPLYMMALIGIGVAVWRRELPDRLTLATIIPYFVVIGGSNVVYPRYLLPMLPALVILAARAVTIIPWRRARPPILAAVWIYSFAFAASQVARFSLDQQREVTQWIAEAARHRGAPARTRVGAPKLMLDYFRLAEPLAAARLAYVELADGHWFDDSPEFFVLPEWYEIAIERDVPNSPVANDLERLRSGAARYDRGARWSSSYLQKSLYTSLDPAFAGDLWQGEIGFTVYVLRDPRSP